jgi:hypothetical protein
MGWYVAHYLFRTLVPSFVRELAKITNSRWGIPATPDVWMGRNSVYFGAINVVRCVPKARRGIPIGGCATVAVGTFFLVLA